MRLKKELVEAREKFVKALYAEHPEFSVDSINAGLKEKYGMIMAPKRILELKLVPTNPCLDVDVSKVGGKFEALVEKAGPLPQTAMITDAHFYNPRVCFLPLSKNLPISKEKLNIVLEDTDGNQKIHEG